MVKSDPEAPRLGYGISSGHVSYRQSYRRCGKERCTTCRAGPGHGPYWYASWREGRTVRSRYVGRELPSIAPKREIDVRTLGRFEVNVPGAARRAWPQKARDLFTLLLSAPTGAVGREELADALWPDFDAVAAQQNVRATVSTIRKLARNPLIIQLIGPTVTLGLPADARDDIRFEQAAHRALAAGDLGLLRSAIALYAGEYLPHDRYNDWTEFRRYQLSQLHRRVVERSAEMAMRAGMFDDAASWLAQVVTADLCDESCARLLMRAHERQGRRSEALRVYRRLVKALREELDVGPEAETRYLFDELRGR